MWGNLDKCGFDQGNKIEPKHVLWALMFLKVYKTEKVHATIAGIGDRQRFREIVWPVIMEIASLRKNIVSSKLHFYDFILNIK